MDNVIKVVTNKEGNDYYRYDKDYDRREDKDKKINVEKEDFQIQGKIGGYF